MLKFRVKQPDSQVKNKLSVNWDVKRYFGKEHREILEQVFITFPKEGDNSSKSESSCAHSAGGCHSI